MEWSGGWWGADLCGRQAVAGRLASAHGLADAQQVPLVVEEPGGPLADAGRRIVALDVGDAVDRPQTRQIDLLEHHAPAAQLRNHGLDVIDLPRHLGMATRGRAGRHKQRESPAAALAPQTARPFLDRFEVEFFRVETPGPAPDPEPGAGWRHRCP